MQGRAGGLCCPAGRIAWKEGDLRAEAGDGKFVERRLSLRAQGQRDWKELTGPRAVKRAAEAEKVTP